MVRYYFNAIDQKSCIEDQEGLCFPSVGLAQKEALRAAADLAAEAIAEGETRYVLQLQVRDQNGDEVIEVTVAASLTTRISPVAPCVVPLPGNGQE